MSEHVEPAPCAAIIDHEPCPNADTSPYTRNGITVWLCPTHGAAIEDQPIT